MPDKFVFWYVAAILVLSCLVGFLATDLLSLKAEKRKYDRDSYGCARCQRSFDKVKPHYTAYEWMHGNLNPKSIIPSREIFVLCEECWRSLTFEQRLPYYERQVLNPKNGWNQKDWPAIAGAVLNEK